MGSYTERLCDHDHDPVTWKGDETVCWFCGFIVENAAEWGAVDRHTRPRGTPIIGH